MKDTLSGPATGLAILTVDRFMEHGIEDIGVPVLSVLDVMKCTVTYATETFKIVMGGLYKRMNPIESARCAKGQAKLKEATWRERTTVG